MSTDPSAVDSLNGIFSLINNLYSEILEAGKVPPNIDLHIWALYEKLQVFTSNEGFDELKEITVAFN